MLELIPITSTTVDFNTLLLTTKKALHRSISDSVDSHNMPARTPAGFLACLGEFHTEGSNPHNVLREAGCFLEFMTYGFLLITNRELTFEIIQESRLPFLTTETIRVDHTLSFLSGTLSQWRTAIINCASDRMPSDIRLFANKSMSYFEKIGLSEVFAKFDKVMMPDQTYRLEYKK